MHSSRDSVEWSGGNRYLRDTLAESIRFDEMQENAAIPSRVPHSLAVRLCHVSIAQAVGDDLQRCQIFAQFGEDDLCHTADSPLPLSLPRRSHLEASARVPTRCSNSTAPKTPAALSCYEPASLCAEEADSGDLLPPQSDPSPPPHSSPAPATPRSSLRHRRGQEIRSSVCTLSSKLEMLLMYKNTSLV